MTRNLNQDPGVQTLQRGDELELRRWAGDIEATCSPEAWFDTQQGNLFEVSSDVEYSGINSRFVRLGQLLLAKEFEFQRGDFPLRPGGDWDREQCEEIGKVAVSELITISGKPVQVTSRMFDRLYILGLGPSRKKRDGLYGNQEELQAAIGSPIVYRRGVFDNWTPKRFQTEAAIIEARVGGKPGVEDYEAAAATGSFPRRRIVTRLMGGHDSVSELLGYPNVAAMSDNDFIEYGRHYWMRNGVDKFIELGFTLVAQRERGPSVSAIQAQFGTIANFKGEVRQRILERKEKLETYRFQIAKGTLTESCAALPDDELLQRGARMELINKITPRLLPRSKRGLANCRKAEDFAETFIAAVEDENKYVTAGFIETEAERLGLDRYIWPKPVYYNDPSKDFIYVSDEELTQARKVRWIKKQEYLARNSAQNEELHDSPTRVPA
jgi:hypothetical protein